MEAERRGRRLRAIQLLLGGVGLLLLAVSAAADLLGLSSYPGLGPGEALLAAAGMLALAGAGVAWGLRREALRPGLLGLARLWRTLLLSGGSALALFVLLETLASLLFAPQGPMPPDAAEYYAAQPWGKQYWEEHARLAHYAYRPYVVWRKSPLAGELITVDAEGRRQTPGATCPPGARELWLFGGSTMWGTGAPDWGTIPAYLQETLRARDPARPVCVHNFGEGGWVSTQERIELLLQLQRGHRPHLVLCYDGINEVYAAYQAGAPTHQNLDAIRGRFEGGLLPRVLESSLTLSLLARRLGGRATYATRGIAADELSEQVLAHYLANLQGLEELAAARGFEVAFFWQPWLGSCAKPLEPQEERIRARLDPALRELFAQVYARAASAAETRPRLHLITGALDDLSGQVWLDAFHVTPEGNARLAEAIAEGLDPN